MKGKYIFCAAGLCSLLMSGCTKEQEQMHYLGIEEAKRLALEEAGFSASEVEITETELNSRNGIDYYEVEFMASGETYEYDIDALTGVVIDADVPLTDTKTADLKDNAVSSDSAGNNNIGSSNGYNTNSNQNAGIKMLTIEAAKAKALAHAGLTNDQVTFVKSTQEYEDGNQIYEVEFYTEDHNEYDYEIDAYTGEVLSFDYDAENVTSSSSGTMIAVEEAKELALAQIPGASVKDIVEFEVDYDEGHTEYDGKIIYNGMEYEFSIDAYSGTFWSWETEPVDD